MLKRLSLGLALLALQTVSCKHAGAATAQDAGAKPAATAPTATAPTAPSTRATATAPAACSVAGVFHGNVMTAHGPATSAMTTKADGSFSIGVTLAANHATTTLVGTYTTSGEDLTFVNTSGTTSNGGHINPCLGVKGVYSMAWTADCKHVTLHKVSDSCPPRELEANGTTLSRD